MRSGIVELDIILACKNLTEVLKKHYGEEGNEMSKRMIDAIDDELRADILEYTLTGYGRVQIVMDMTYQFNKVRIIKALRLVKEYSLREAKDIADGIERDGNAFIDLDSIDSMVILRDNLSGSGAIVSGI